MGSIVDLRTKPDPENFPGATFVIDGTPPIAQCKEEEPEILNGSITNGQPTITKVGAFTQFDLTGKTVSVAWPLSQLGTYNILSHTDDILTTDHTFTLTSAAVTAYCQDPGQSYLTRTENSFARYLQSIGAPYTFKGGKLYTSNPDPPMGDACELTWNPL